MRARLVGDMVAVSCGYVSSKSLAAKLRVAHATLKWEGVKPATRLQERARIGKTPCHNPIERRANPRRVGERCIAPMLGFGAVQCLPGGREFRLRRIDLCARCRIFCLRVVKLLLRNQPGARIRRLLQAFRGRVKRHMIRHGPRHGALRALDVLLAPLHPGLRTFHLRGQVRGDHARELVVRI